MEMPKPSAGHAELERLVGSWEGEETMHPTTIHLRVACDEASAQAFIDGDDWQRIMNGEDVTVFGDGRRNDESIVRGQWHFRGGLDGELRISHGPRCDEGDDGWIGTPRQAWRESLGDG